MKRVKTQSFTLGNITFNGNNNESEAYNAKNALGIDTPDVGAKIQVNTRSW
jgi:hypothetical protein